MTGRTFAFFIIFLIALLDSIGFGIILPVMPSLLMEISGEDLSSSAVYGGWLLFAFAIMQFLAMPVIGNLSDAYGRKKILLVSLSVLAINYLIMGIAESLWLLLVGRIISGIGSATFSTCNAFIADLTTPEERAQFFGMTGAAFGAGFVLGPVIGGLLGDYGTRAPFFATSALALTSLVMTLVFLPESLRPALRRPFVLARANPVSVLLDLRKFRIVLGIIAVMFFYNLGHHSLPTVWSFYGMEKFNWSPREIGVSLAFIGVLMVLVQGLLIRAVVPALGLRRAGIFGFSCMILGFMGYALAYDNITIAAAMIIAALGALSGPAMSGIASGMVGPTQQGELQGAIGSFMSLTAIISPPVMTGVFGAFSGNDAIYYFPGAPYMLAAVLTIVAMLLFIHVTRNFTEPEPDTDAR